MEGWRRGAAWTALVLTSGALVASASGCGDDESSASDAPVGIRTAHPEQTFAPLVKLAADEPWRPMGGRWFVERSVLWNADDQGCRDAEVAVGHTLPERQNADIDWIYPTGLGAQDKPAYDRVPHDGNCDVGSDRVIYADQLTRPFDPGPRTPAGARRGEGFWLNLIDDNRAGQALGPGRRVVAPAYAERTDEGDGGVRLTYWMLFGMHGEPGAPNAHEGDWERVDVLLKDRGDDTYEPRSIQLAGLTSRQRPWSKTRKIDGTHPVVTAARATHTLALATPGKQCVDCLDWATWKPSIADVRKQPWYGFGGAWGDIGTSSATTGPLGPHGYFATDAEKRLETGYY